MPRIPLHCRASLCHGVIHGCSLKHASELLVIPYAPSKSESL